MPSATHSRSKKSIHYIFIALGIIFLIFTFYQIFFYFNPRARINFTTFKPNGYEIVKTELVISTPLIGIPLKNTDTVIFPKVYLNYRLEGKDVSFRLEKGKGFTYDCAQQYSSSNCKIHRRPSGQEYLLRDDTFSTGSREGSIAFLKNNTRISFWWDQDEPWLFDPKEQAKLIDSFQTAAFPNIPFRREHPGGA